MTPLTLSMSRTPVRWKPFVESAVELASASSAVVPTGSVSGFPNSFVLPIRRSPPHKNGLVVVVSNVSRKILQSTVLMIVTSIEAPTKMKHAGSSFVTF